MNAALPAVKFGREPLASMLESDLEMLNRAHWEEVAHDREAIPLDVNWPEYMRQEREGRFVGFALRRGAALIGYTGFFVVRSIRYRSAIFAMNDVIYLTPAERGAEGIAMIVEAEKLLAAMGATKIFYHVKTDAILGSVDGDSLEAVDARLEIEERTGIDLPDTIFDLGDRTLGHVLAQLGYAHVENHYGKLVGRAP